MKKDLIILIFFVSLLLLTACSSRLDPAAEELASCLSEKGVKFYGAYWCPHCNDQKELFGKAVESFYVECSLPSAQGQTEICQEAGVKAYPTWEFQDGTKREGVLSLEQIKELSGC